MRLARKLIYSGLFMVILAGILLAATYLHGQAYSSAASGESVNWSQVTAASPSPSVPIPSPKTDTCLHCHVTGEDKNLWTPLARWLG